MEYKKPESFYEIVKKIGKSLYFNFISGEPRPDGSVYKKNTGWDPRHSHKKISKEIKKTIDDKV